MATVLHLLGDKGASLAVPVIEGQLAAGDRVTVAAIGEAPPPLPPGLEVHRVPANLSYSQLLDLIFASDHVITW